MRLRQQLICFSEEKPVPAEEQVKGFEVEENKYILVDTEELERTAPESSRTIEVHEFVEAGQIDPLFPDRAYHLERDDQLRPGRDPGAANQRRRARPRLLPHAPRQGPCSPAAEDVLPGGGDNRPSPEEIVRGYERALDKNTTVTDEELESLTSERSRTIEILEFINLKDVDPLYYRRPYYLVPAKGGEKAYQLLVEVLRRTDKAGRARFVLGEREHLVAVKSEDGALSLVTLHYHSDILPAADLAPEKVAVESGAMRLVQREIRKIIADFTPEKYAGQRRKKIVEYLRKKAEATGRAFRSAPG